MIELRKADILDCEEIHILQVKSFQALLDKYNDISTNPAAEPIERIAQKMSQSFTDYYFIQFDNKNIGAIRIVRLDNSIYRISPMFILPEFQGNGYAQKAITKAESLYPKANGWQLDTIRRRTEVMLPL